MWEEVIAGAVGLIGLYVALRNEVRRSHELLHQDIGHLDTRITQLDGRVVQLDARVAADIGRLDQKLDAHIGRLDQKIDAVRGELITVLGQR